MLGSLATLACFQIGSVETLIPNGYPRIKASIPIGTVPGLLGISLIGYNAAPGSPGSGRATTSTPGDIECCRQRGSPSALRSGRTTGARCPGGEPTRSNCTVTSSGSPACFDKCKPVSGFLPVTLCQFVIRNARPSTRQTNPVPFARDLPRNVISNGFAARKYSSMGKLRALLIPRTLAHDRPNLKGVGLRQPAGFLAASEPSQDHCSPNPSPTSRPRSLVRQRRHVREPTPDQGAPIRSNLDKLVIPRAEPSEKIARLFEVVSDDLALEFVPVGRASDRLHSGTLPPPRRSGESVPVADHPGISSRSNACPNVRPSAQVTSVSRRSSRPRAPNPHFSHSVVHRASESGKSCFARTTCADSERQPDADGV